MYMIALYEIASAYVMPTRFFILRIYTYLVLLEFTAFLKPLPIIVQNRSPCVYSYHNDFRSSYNLQRYYL